MFVAGIFAVHFIITIKPNVIVVVIVDICVSVLSVCLTLSVRRRGA